MKIIGEDFNTQEDILKLINKSTPSSSAKLLITKIEEHSGWICITGCVDNSEFYIKYSSYMFDTSILISFFAELVDLKEDIAMFLDNEGSFPMLYAKNIDNDNVRFMFAHDYILFENDEADDDCLPLYKIECDVIISKHILLEEFYNILFPYTKNYDLKLIEAHYSEFNLKNGGKYLEIIKKYLNV